MCGMTLPTHALAGLLIGQTTGAWWPALLGAVAIDADHLISYARSGVLFRPPLLKKALLDPEDPWGDQRSYLHSLPVFALIAAVLYLAFPGSAVALAFILGYASHLLLDTLDRSEYWPFFPNKKLSLRGPIGYYSKSELAFAGALAIILGILVLR